MKPFLLLALMTLTACSSLLSGGPAPNLYTLSPAARFADGLPKVSWQLLIEEPGAVGGLESNRIAVQPTPNEVKYFGDVRWVERAPRMIQGLLVESFERSKAVAAVDRYAVGVRADYILKSEIRDFQAELFENSKLPTVRVRLVAKLVRAGRQDILWTREFETRLTAKASTAPDVVAAFDEALGQAMAEIVAVAVRETPPVR